MFTISYQSYPLLEKFSTFFLWSKKANLSLYKKIYSILKSTPMLQILVNHPLLCLKYFCFYPAFRPDSSRQDSREYVLVVKKVNNSLCDVGVQTVAKTVEFLLVSFRVNFALWFCFVYKLQENFTIKTYSVKLQ